jgi:hypothetical protein
MLSLIYWLYLHAQNFTWCHGTCFNIVVYVVNSCRNCSVSEGKLFFLPLEVKESRESVLKCVQSCSRNCVASYSAPRSRYCLCVQGNVTCSDIFTHPTSRKSLEYIYRIGTPVDRMTVTMYTAVLHGFACRTKWRPLVVEYNVPWGVKWGENMK